MRFILESGREEGPRNFVRTKEAQRERVMYEAKEKGERQDTIVNLLMPVEHYV